MKDGKATLDLSKDEKLALPATVEVLRSAVLELMPHARLADAFLEVEDWTDFSDDFPHLNEQQTAPNVTHALIWRCLLRSWRMASTSR